MNSFSPVGSASLPAGRGLPLSGRLTIVAALAAVSTAICAQTSEPATDRTERVTVVGERIYPIVDSVSPDTGAAIDTAELLRQLPGANLNANGVVTGIAQYRGLYGDRVAISMDGSSPLSGGPNAMDAPLSYASPLLLSHLSLERGIASVASATESFGGHIALDHDRGRHGDGTDFGFSGKAQAGFIDNGNVSSTALQLVGANRSHKFALLAQRDDGDDIEFPGGTLTPTRLDRERRDLSYAYNNDSTEALVYLGKLETSDTGTPALPMDIRVIDTDMSGFSLAKHIGQRTTLRVRLTDTDVEHVMDNFGLRAPPASPMGYRSTFATGNGQRWRIAGETQIDGGSWQVGVDGTTSSHTATITNPNVAPFRIDNFNDATRDITDIFGQWNGESGRYDFEAGIRYNRIETDAGLVSASIPAMNPMMQMMANAAGMLAGAFNAADRSRTHDNVDVVLKLGRTLSSTRNVYVEIARKTRAPSYQELFLWLPLEATGGLADGRSYLGNPGLRSEVSREINVGSNWQSGRAWLAPQVFFKGIDDYIQGTPTANTIANNVAMMMTGNPALEFANTDARLYGIDLAWGFYLSDRLTLTGTLTRVYGERTDVDDNLYRLAPLNGTIALSWSVNDWLLRLETVAYDAQDDVSAYNAEQRTPGYGIVNAGGEWQIRDRLQLSARVSNLFDNGYRDHLDGINRAQNPAIPAGERLWGAGRSLQLGIRYEW